MTPTDTPETDALREAIDNGAATEAEMTSLAAKLERERVPVREHPLRADDAPLGGEEHEKSDTPETHEAVERWRQGKINIFDEMARLETERNLALMVGRYQERLKKIYKTIAKEARRESEEQATLLGKSSEREAALLAKLEMQKKDIRNGYEGTCYACECVGELNQKYRDNVRELIRLLDIEEESDNGRVFKPNHVTSCRVMDGMQINQCLKNLKELAQA